MTPPTTRGLSPMTRVLSLGAGVQSSTLALMIAHGEVQPIHAAVFADTRAEPRAVYDWLAWLTEEIARLPNSFPVTIVSQGDLEEANLRIRVNRKNGNRYVKHSVPTFTHADDGTHGMRGRECTSDYKVIPILREVRRIARVRRGETRPVVDQLLGISRDEVVRMKPSREPWKVHSFPLVDLDMTRQGCKDWMSAKGYPEPPRSACVFCPYHSDSEWARLKANDPDGFMRAARFEVALNATPKDVIGATRGTETLHKSGVALTEVQFGGDPAQMTLGAWGNECEGMCGV